MNAKKNSNQNITEAIVLLSNLKNFELGDSGDIVKNQINQIIERLEWANKNMVTIETPSHDIRGDLSNWESTLARYKIRVFLRKFSVVLDVIMLRKVTDMNLPEAKKFAETYQTIEIEGNWAEIRRTAFILGGMGYRYEIREIPFENSNKD